MWIQTTIGHFSIVKAHANPVKRLPIEPHPELFMVRARCRRHLEALCDLLPYDQPTHRDIKTTTNTDYRYRVFILRHKMESLMRVLVQNLDYTNFKDAAAETAYDPPYKAFLGKVWAAGALMTNTPHPNDQPPGIKPETIETAAKHAAEADKLFKTPGTLHRTLGMAEEMQKLEDL